jgi:hypothetical protein
MVADFIGEEKAERNTGIEPMRSWSGRERGESRGDNTGKKQTETFTDAAQVDELSKMEMMEQEETRESSHHPQPAEDDIWTDAMSSLHWNAKESDHATGDVLHGIRTDGWTWFLHDFMKLKT